jgi:hypothetical protein
VIAVASHPQRPIRPNRPVVQRPDRLGLDGVGPADQRGLIGDLLALDLTGLPEHEAVVDEGLGPLSGKKARL